MQQSGNKLVVVLCLLALSAGVVGWSYRYQAAHRTAEFWGPSAGQLIQGPSKAYFFSVLGVLPDAAGVSDSRVLKFDARSDISGARGLSHLRNALSLDRNFLWNKATPIGAVDWAVGLRFSRAEKAVTMVFSRDFRTLGKVNQDRQLVKTVSCAPMSVALTTYFKSLGFNAQRSDTAGVPEAEASRVASP